MILFISISPVISPGSTMSSSNSGFVSSIGLNLSKVGFISLAVSSHCIRESMAAENAPKAEIKPINSPMDIDIP